MNKYNLDTEFKKISDSFGRVRIDMNKLFTIVNKLNTRIGEQENTIRLLNTELATLKLEKDVSINNCDCDEKIIVANIDSKKFHYANCPYAKNIKGDNKIIFESIEQAIKAGYTECSCIRDE